MAHPDTYRARVPLCFDGWPYRPGDELRVAKPAGEAPSKVIIVDGVQVRQQDGRLLQGGRLFFYDEFGQRWTIKTRMGYPEAVFTPESPVAGHLATLVAQDRAWAPGEGPEGDDE